MQSKVVDLSSLNDREALKKRLLDSALAVVQEVATHLSDRAKSVDDTIPDRSSLLGFRDVLREVKRSVPGFGQNLPEDLVQAAVVIVREIV